MKPSVGGIVHYVSYGTPGGEYASQCRAASITEAGCWVTTDTQRIGPGSDDPAQQPKAGDQRVISQTYDPEACALFVKNPTGLFLDQVIRHDEEKAPGTWHWPERVDG